jgi:hypothetical protein
METQETRTPGAARTGEAFNKIKSEGTEAAQELKRRGQEQFESRKHTAADQAEGLAGVVDRAAEELREQDQQSLADYAGQLAGNMKNLAESLRERSLDDLISDTQQLARNNPTLFVMGSIMAGLALSRFFKASAQRSAHGRDNEHHIRSGGGELQAQPATFESRRSVISESATPTPSSTGEAPSFADDSEKGV